MRDNLIMKIVFEPNQSKSNAYVNIIRESVYRLGITSYSINSVFKNWSQWTEVSVVHLNWFENVNGVGDFLKKLIKLLAFVIWGKHIVWTFHNKKPHNQSYEKLSRFVMYLLANLSKYIVIHSRVSEGILVEYYGEKIRSKIKYIPHPNYIGVYGENEVKEVIPQSPLSLIFFGAVKPYKNIELLIDAIQSFDKNSVELTIAGNPFSKEYKQNLENRAQAYPNIHLQLQFISDEQIGELFSGYDLVVLPYSIESSLNSGSVLLAFSYGKTVICPNIGTISDFPDSENIVVYDYDTSENHLPGLKNAIAKAIALKKTDDRIFEKMGQKMFHEVKEKNNIDSVGRSLTELYKSLK